MKFSFKSFVSGVIFTSLGVATVFATGTIKSAEFNNTSVIFNGTELDLNGNQMISVTTNENSDAVSNYMPVRAILEQMGYEVDFDGGRNAVIVNSSESVSNLNNSSSNDNASYNDNIRLIHFEEEREYIHIGEVSFNMSDITRDHFVSIGNKGINDNTIVIRQLETILLEIPESEVSESRNHISLNFYDQYILPLMQQFS